MKQGKRIRTIAGLIGVVVVAAVTATSSPGVAAAGPRARARAIRVQPRSPVTSKRPASVPRSPHRNAWPCSASTATRRYSSARRTT